MRAVQPSGSRTRMASLPRQGGDRQLADPPDRKMSSSVPTAATGFPKTPGDHGGRHRRNSQRRNLPVVLSSGAWSLVVATAGVNGLNFLFHVLISRLLGPSC